MNVTFEEVKNNKDIKTYIAKADESLLALGYTESDTETPFSDTEDGLILALYDAGIMEGSEDVNGNQVYLPDNNIRRSEISTVIWRINNYRAE